MSNQPNLVFVFGDQWRLQALGCKGDPNVKTPHIDRLASQSLDFTTAISGCPVCCPARATLQTGQYPLTHGVIANDVPLEGDRAYLGQSFKDAGYDTAYIGKWHINANGRSNYIPPDRQRGWDYWRVLECTHQYNDSYYYKGGDPTKRQWDGYDAIAQTRDAQQYIRDHASGDKPFAITLSWGPPHDPYQTAPQQYRDMYDPATLELRDNVPRGGEMEQKARQWLAGYYAHCTALDDCVGDLLQTLDDEGIADNTLFVFWSDHGDLVGSHGGKDKQQPVDESIRVPLMIRWPEAFGAQGRAVEAPINTPDLMPTLLDLCGIDVPSSCEGVSYAPYLRGDAEAPADAALIACYHPFGQWHRGKGGREFRGVRTPRYTYTRTLDGPWQLFDNEQDPCQLNNLITSPEHAEIRVELDAKTQAILDAQGDRFLPGETYMNSFGYEMDQTGTVPYGK